MADKKVENLDGSMTVAEMMAQAKREVVAKRNAAAVTALKTRYEQLVLAEQSLANLKRDIADLERAIEDGSFNPGRV